MSQLFPAGVSLLMLLQRAVLATFAFASSTLAAFGITTSGNNIVVDAGSDNAFKITVNKNSCDITSILYRGEEFQYSSKGSHISSGLGTATVSSTIVSSRPTPALLALLNIAQSLTLSRSIRENYLYDTNSYALHCRQIR